MKLSHILALSLISLLTGCGDTSSTDDTKIIAITAKDNVANIEKNIEETDVDIVDYSSENRTNKKPFKPLENYISEPKLSGVHINEVLAANSNIMLDPDFYKFSDYIELKNYENHSINIGGYILSDDKKSWKIPSGTTMSSNSYLLIWADKKNSKKKGLHTNFKLSQKKESITLKDSNGHVIDSIKYKKVPGNVSIRAIDSSIVYMTPTPNRANKNILKTLVRSDKPQFSKEGGLYGSMQMIKLSNANGGDIYYTLDGTTPTKNSKRYTSPLRLDSSRVIKAASFEKGKIKSKVAVNSYILGFDTMLPVVSLSMDSKYLYDDYIGIYVAGKNGVYYGGCGVTTSGNKNYGQKWKRPVQVEYFDADHKKQFTFGSNIAVAGQCSRNNEKKQFKIQLDSKYGVKSIKYKFYEDKDDIKIKDFRLRTGHRAYEIGDLLAAELAADGFLNIDYQASQPVQMYMNGEYWGIYNMRERKSVEYLKSNYPDLDEKKVDIVKIWEAKEGDKKEYEALLDYLTSNHSAVEKYNKAVANVDVDSFIDYMTLMIYSGNNDWIFSNNRCWKEKGKNSRYNKWRWMIDDVDMGFQYFLVDSNAFLLSLAKNDKYKNSNNKNLMTEVFKALLTNVSFKASFKRRFLELLDTTYSPENINTIVDKIVSQRKNEMSTSGKYNYPDKFDNHIKGVRKFIDKRSSVVLKQLRSF
jgi:hypothetical protein